METTSLQTTLCTYIDDVSSKKLRRVFKKVDEQSLHMFWDGEEMTGIIELYFETSAQVISRAWLRVRSRQSKNICE